ncbi:HAMP domain-containing sensor histidine kinase [Lichenicoccus roseus]|uniref:HAMP domain-containing protein n=1 Tax=Lichenicoccus roseus TaxID=2683649 RepID=A0A5R9J6N6_9PROT|nr:histidine kinase [Lichenicoccus roseus]TLU72147.1 HAMP domain-containing protein [Lichenicoccus roseus]
MSLRRRLILAVAAALFASFAVGTWITALQSAHMVRSELSAALRTGAGSVAAALQDIGRPPGREALRRLVGGFDGSRHLRAELVVGGTVVQGSQPAHGKLLPPAWFTVLVAPSLRPVELVVPGGTLRLVPLASNEIAERWSEARRLIGLLLLSSLLSASFCVATTAMSLRRLRPLGDALRRIEQGLPSHTLAELGPPEIAQLTASFNRMQAALARASADNRRLSVQLERLADEERAELARDLHDEVGPLLFALTAWATAAEMQQRDGDHPAAGGSLRCMREAAEGLQAAVRGMLHRLRDSAPAPVELAGSVAGLLDFWRGVRPQTVFTAEIEPELDTLGEPVRAALFRVAQEGLSNAVRHGRPSHVVVAAAVHGPVASLSVEDDGQAAAIQGTGLGLIGLEERLRALGGTLEVRREGGWRLAAVVPAQGLAAAPCQGAAAP